MNMTHNRFKYALIAIAVIVAASVLMGHPLVAPEALAGLGALPFMVGDTKSIGDIVELIEKQGKAWEEFKKANDARLDAIEKKGYAPADLTEKVETIKADLIAIGKQYTELEKKANRPGAGGGSDQLTDDQVAHRKAFNLYLRRGRDDGPLANPAHYFILVGLFFLFIAGALAMTSACTVASTAIVP